MTLTYSCINKARHITIYVLGGNKAGILSDVLNPLTKPDKFPIQKVGTVLNPANWIVDASAAALLNIN